MKGIPIELYFNGFHDGHELDIEQIIADEMSELPESVNTTEFWKEYKTNEESLYLAVSKLYVDALKQKLNGRFQDSGIDFNELEFHELEPGKITEDNKLIPYRLVATLPEDTLKLMLDAVNRNKQDNFQREINYLVDNKKERDDINENYSNNPEDWKSKPISSWDRHETGALFCAFTENESIIFSIEQKDKLEEVIFNHLSDECKIWLKTMKKSHGVYLSEDTSDEQKKRLVHAIDNTVEALNRDSELFLKQIKLLMDFRASIEHTEHFKSQDFIFKQLSNSVFDAAKSNDTGAFIKIMTFTKLLKEYQKLLTPEDQSDLARWITVKNQEPEHLFKELETFDTNNINEFIRYKENMLNALNHKLKTLTLLGQNTSDEFKTMQNNANKLAKKIENTKPLLNEGKALIEELDKAQKIEEGYQWTNEWPN